MNLIAITLATFFIAYAFVETDGPWGVFYRLRKFGKPFDCFMCMSLWVSFCLAFLPLYSNLTESFISILAAAGGAVLLKRVSDTL
jgi:uncharacterized membrane protein YccC